MLKKLFFLFIMVFYLASAEDGSQAINEKIQKYSEYKKIVAENREKEIQKIIPSPQELNIYYTKEKLNLEKEKLEYEKKLAYERAEYERRRDNLIDAVIVGGVGYGGYRLGRHHHWW